MFRAKFFVKWGKRAVNTLHCKEDWEAWRAAGVSAQF